ncbi:MAG: hypothetical protein LBQ48_07290 [Oscillospiraceae bacterium]|jgi:hypothetical protein|nr:hypothetical protein [Oscillospiraceae bacterium]
MKKRFLIALMLLALLVTPLAACKKTPGDESDPSTEDSSAQTGTESDETGSGGETGETSGEDSAADSEAGAVGSIAQGASAGSTAGASSKASSSKGSVRPPNIVTKPITDYNPETPVDAPWLKDDRSRFFGLDPEFQGADTMAREFESYEELGIKRMRMTLRLDKSGGDPDSPDFYLYDKTIALGKTYDVMPMVLISNDYLQLPNVQKPAGTGEGWNMQITDAVINTITSRVKLIIQHFFALGVTQFEIWDEPNNHFYIDPETYGKVISAIYEKCYFTEKWTGGKQVYICGMSVRAEYSDKYSAAGYNTDAVAYMDAVYKSAAVKAFIAKYNRFPLDAVSIHPFNTVVYNEVGAKQKDVLGKTMEQFTAMKKANNSEFLPIWITAMGVNISDEAVAATAAENIINQIANLPQIEYLFWFKMKYDGSDWGLVKEATWTKKKIYFKIADVIPTLKSIKLTWK